MPAENPNKETKVQRLELLVVYGLCVALLAGLAFLWARQQGWFGAAPDVEHAAGREPAKPIEINTARWSDLTQIRLIGPARAKEILFRRDEKIRQQKLHKEKLLGFRDFDDFMTSIDNIPGLTADVRAQMREMIRVEPIRK